VTATLRTNAWDLVAAIRQDTLNDQLVALYNAGRLITEVHEVINIPLAGEATVDMKVGAPVFKLDKSVVNLVQITFPIRGGSIANKFVNVPIPEQGLDIVVVTDLQYVHLEIEGEGHVLRLAIDFTSPDAVYNVVMEGTPPGWDPDYNDIIGEALRKKLREDASKHDYDHPYHLGNIVLPDGIPEDLEPTGEADFTTQIVDRSDKGGDNIIGLLMTTAGDQSGISNVFSNLPAVVPQGHVSSLIVSNEVLMKKVVTPQVAKSLGAGAGDFAFSGGGTTPVTSSLKTHPYLGGDYSIYMWNATAQVDNNAIVVNYEAHAHPLVDTKEAFYIKVTGSITITPQLQTNDKGEQEIVFTGTHSDPDGHVECDWYVYPIVVAAIIVSFGTLSLAFAAIAAIVIPILMATLTFPVDLPSQIKTELNQGLASFKWPLQTAYPLDGVSLPGDLIITGVPHLA